MWHFIKQLIWRPKPSLSDEAMPLDGWLLASAGFLIMLGFVAVSSASIEVASEKYGNAYFFMMRHGLYIILALLVAAVCWRVPTRFWQMWSPWLMLFAGALLILVLVVGARINGSQRWISLGIMNFQPSELAKVAMILYVAGYLYRRNEEVRSRLSGILIPMIPLMGYVGLLAKEPDFGASVVITATVIVMVFLGGMGVMHALSLFGATAFALLAVFFTNKDYRVERIESYLDPWQQAFGDGYQQVQAQIAFGRGEWFGAGLGNSVQKLMYLPEAHTDFVMSVLAEELGFAGATLLILAYVVMIARMFKIGRAAERAGKLFNGYVVYGIGVLLAGQALINIGVNVGALPPKGITLPLVSFGGSSMLITGMMLAIVLRIDFELRLSRLQQVTQDDQDQSETSAGVLGGRQGA